ncbi:hypothetical protein [Galbibacter sp. PAP.153]|uniref:hypothetical protein n=1 Tax=Galbibacter sp. PAP.153 TaxID=3104623 RepID=UPI003009FDCE
MIVNCKSQKHAEQILETIKRRMQQIGLELHPKKTKIVYCKDYRRKGMYPHVKFDFLSYSYYKATYLPILIY